MTDRDEPISAPGDDEGVLEISDDLIIQAGETLPGAVPAPGKEPTETSQSWSDESAPVPARAPGPVRRQEPDPRAHPVARLTPARPIARQLATPSPDLQQEAPRLDEASTRVVIVPKDSAPRKGPSKLLAFAFLLVGLGAGFYGGVQWERHGGLGGLLALRGVLPSAPPAPAPAARDEDGDEERSAAGEKAAPATKRPSRTTKAAPAKAPRAPTARAETVEKGRLDVTAPAGAEIYLDGKRIGRGSLKADVAPGRHRIEVRLGKSRVAETFEAEPGITWTYEVTPK